MSTYTVTLYNFTGLPLNITDNARFNYNLPCDVGGNSFVAPSVKLAVGAAASYSVGSVGYDATKTSYQIAPYKFTVPVVPGDTDLFLAVDRSKFVGDQISRSGYITKYDPSDPTILYLKCVKGKIVNGRKIATNFSVVPYANSKDSEQLLVLPLLPTGVKKGDIDTQITARIKKINKWIVGGAEYGEEESSMSWFVWVMLIIIVLVVIIALVGGSIAAWKYYQSRNM
jgi:hypothetical protein